MTSGWLIDKSVLARAGKLQIATILGPRINVGLVSICIVTELEVAFSARSVGDHDEIVRLIDRLIPVITPVHAERKARELQRRLVEAGQHRAVGIADLLVAATADASGLTVLHYDHDFDLITEVTGQKTEWIVPPGQGD